MQLAFDDFGTGYASLSFLTRFPLTRLKIDQSFVSKIGVAAQSQDTAIARSIIVMAHNLGLEVIAEGIETETQSKFLRQEGCDEGQGYLFAKPMPAEQFREFLADRSIVTRGVDGRQQVAAVDPASVTCRLRSGGTAATPAGTSNTLKSRL